MELIVTIIIVAIVWIWLNSLNNDQEKPYTDVEIMQNNLKQAIEKGDEKGIKSARECLEWSLREEIKKEQMRDRSRPENRSIYINAMKNGIHINSPEDELHDRISAENLLRENWSNYLDSLSEEKKPE